MLELSRLYGWSLSGPELAAIQVHFRFLQRDPTRAEMETIGQTWSEHCKHKTLTGPIRYTEGKRVRLFSNLLRETVMDATLTLAKPWCLSVFRDNAGIVRFNDRWAVAYKVETHNHPCAVEPYGGASTGVGGVIRDVLGAGLGAQPILNTDIFCLAPPDFQGELPQGVPHPRRTLSSVVGGVRDYGNRMGIPTASGALWFDEEFRFNPLVFCGTVGLLPSWAVRKEIKPGDLIVAIGGPTGRDGLHGATFSSAALDDSAAPSAVQIGHAIVEKRLLDALRVAQNRRLYRSITDCGAGGFSSAVGEMAASCGARVDLGRAILKAADIEPWEIWVSESQERMVLAVPPKNLPPLQEVLEAEGVDLSVLGEFTNTRRLEVDYKGHRIVDLALDFLHEGLPRPERIAVWTPPKKASGHKQRARPKDLSQRVRETLHALLAHPNVCSRAWIIRQYDHEVQAGTVLKPLQGADHDGPGDACVLWPQTVTGDLEDFQGIAVAHGLNPSYGKIDPYSMAIGCVDEALRNLTCVGADTSQAALLDNFCWGSPEDPEVLGGLVRAALGCRDAALGYGVPFISGKDSLYNEFQPTGSRASNGKGAPAGPNGEGERHPIPGTLLISAMAPVPDIRKAVTMEFKASGNILYLVGRTMEELGGSLYGALAGLEGRLPQTDPRGACQVLRSLGLAIQDGLALSCHDLSEGGLGVALAEMAFSGQVGAAIDLDRVPRPRDLQDEETILFSESLTRFLVEVVPEKEKLFLRALRDVPMARVGATIANPVLRLTGMDGCVFLEEPLERLKDSWVRTLPRLMEGK